MTEVKTTRFGTIRVSAVDLLRFPQGLVGLETQDRWILLSDTASPSVGWLQSTAEAETALAVVSPRRFVPTYRFRVSQEQLGLIELDELDRAFVLVVVAKNSGLLTANLKAPVIVNLDRRLGCQIVAADDQPLQYAIASPTPTLRKIA